MQNVKIEIIDKNVETKMPTYATDGSSGMDVYSTNDKPINLSAGERILMPLNFKIEIQSDTKDYEVQVRPKSGLALKFGIGVLNSPGTVDYDYRGNIGIILVNHGCEEYTIQPHQKIAQIVLQQIEKINWELVDGTLTDTERGKGGFGSTGLK